MRHAAKQQDHAPHGLPGVCHAPKPACDGRSLDGAALVHPTARDQHGLTARCPRGDKRVLSPLVRLQIQKATHKAAPLAVEHLGHVLENLRVTTEIANELNQRTRGRTRRGRLSNRALLAAKHFDIGPAKAIDGLLGVAHGAQGSRTRPRQLHDEVNLLLIGILELVDHHHLEAPGIGLTHRGVVAEGLARTTQQVVVVEQRGGVLERAILGLDHTAQVEQLAHRGHPAGHGRIDKGVDSLDLEQVRLVFWKGLGDTGRLACEHANGKVIKGLFAVLKSLDGIESLAGARPGRRARLEAGAVRVCQSREIKGAAREMHVVQALRHTCSKLENLLHQRAHAHARLAPARCHLSAQRVAGKQCGKGILRGHASLDIRTIAAKDTREHMLNRLVEQNTGRRFPKHLELRVDPQLKGMSAQDARAHAMNGGDPGVIDQQRFLLHAGIYKCAAHALANLGRRVIGKRDREYLIQVLDKRSRLGRKRPQNAARQREGLARTCARRDE